MARLRAEDGCPWDREQTHLSLRSYLLEESYEAIEAVEAGDDDELCQELGDVLLQIVFHAQIAREDGRFTADDVCRAIVDKLIRRHPHVFGDVEVDDAEHVKANWDRIKRDEKGETPAPRSAVDGVPRHLPALLRAQRIQERASQVGFDWDELSGPLEKVAEEVEEMRQAWAALSDDDGEDGEARARLEEEYGDLLFALVNAARFLEITPEDSLRRAVGKFESRFRQVERVFRERGSELADASLEEMDRVWDQVKESEDRAGPRGVADD